MNKPYKRTPRLPVPVAAYINSEIYEALTAPIPNKYAALRMRDIPNIINEIPGGVSTLSLMLHSMAGTEKVKLILGCGDKAGKVTLELIAEVCDGIYCNKAFDIPGHIKQYGETLAFATKVFKRLLDQHDIGKEYLTQIHQAFQNELSLNGISQY